MKKLLLLLIALGMMLEAGEYAVISNGSVTQLSSYQIKAIYLRKMKFHNGLRLIPLNLPPKSEIRKSFEKEVLHMSFSRLRAYWTKEHYHGNRPPIMVQSQEGVKRFVKEVDGAIGYIELKNMDENLTILYKWSE